MRNSILRPILVVCVFVLGATGLAGAQSEGKQVAPVPPKPATAPVDAKAAPVDDAKAAPVDAMAAPVDAMAAPVDVQSQAVLPTMAAQDPQAQRAAAEAAAAQALAERVRLARAAITGDRGVLGVALLEPVSLPTCARELELPSDLMGIGRGAKRTCQVAPDVRLPRALDAAFKATVSTAQGGRTWVPIVIEHRLCPEWMRSGGTCMFLVSVADGVAAGALLVTGTNAKAIEQHLAGKYRAPAKDGDDVHCGNRRTHMTSSHTVERVWTPPGLSVSFEPIARDCTHGRILIETPLLFPPVAPPSTDDGRAPIAPAAPVVSGPVVPSPGAVDLSGAAPSSELPAPASAE